MFTLKLLIFTTILLFALPLFAKSSNLKFIIYTTESQCGNCTFAGLNGTIEGINNMFSSPQIKVYITHPLKVMMKKMKYSENVEILDAIDIGNDTNLKRNFILIEDSNGLVLHYLDNFQRNPLIAHLYQSPLVYEDSLNITLILDSLNDNIGSLYSEKIYNGYIEQYKHTIAFIDKYTNKINIADATQKRIIKTIDMPDTLSNYAFYQDKRDIIKKQLISYSKTGYFTAKFEKIISYTDTTLDFLSSIFTKFIFNTVYDVTLKDSVVNIRPTIEIKRIKYDFIDNKILSVNSVGDNISETLSPTFVDDQVFYFAKDYFTIRMDTNITMDSINKSSYYLIESINTRDKIIKRYLKAAYFFKIANIKPIDMSPKIQPQFSLLCATSKGLVASIIDTVLLFIDYGTGAVKKLDIPSYMKVYENQNVLTSVSKIYNQEFKNNNYMILRSLFPLQDGFIINLKLTPINNNYAEYLIICRYDNVGNLKEERVINLKKFGKITFLDSYSAQNNEVHFMGILNNEKIISFSVNLLL